MQKSTKTIKKTSKLTKKVPKTSKIDDKTPELIKTESKLYEGFDFRPVGRPTKYSQKMVDKTYDFIRLRVERGNIPVVEGLALYLRISKDTVYAWGKKHKKFSYALDSLIKTQGEMLQMNGINGWYNPTITQLLLKNNHGFKDKHEVDHTSAGERIEKINYIEPTDPTDPK